MKKTFLFMMLLCFLSLLTSCVLMESPSKTEESVITLPEKTTEPAKTEEEVHTHKFSSWITVTDSVCNKEGLSRRACSCGEAEEKSIPAKEHAWTGGDCEKAPTCKYCKVKQDITPTHAIENGVCTKCNKSFRTEEDVKGIIKLINASIYRIDSAGGVSIDIGWENTSDKTVKYIYFTTGIFNAVGDPLSCDIRDYYETNLKHTGPFKPGERNYSINDNGSYKQSSYVFDNVWYADTAKSVEISKIKIQYTDGSEVILNEDEVKLAKSDMTLSTKVEKIDCPYTKSYTVYGVDGDILIKLGLVSDEGYYIRKYGTMKLKMTNLKATSNPLKWDKLDVFYETTVFLLEGAYPVPHSNELQVMVSPGFSEKGQHIFEIEYTFIFDDGSEITHTSMAIARVI